jgi:hypothetical protein
MLKGIDELAESLLDLLQSGGSRRGAHRPGLGRRLNGLIPQLLGDAGERIKGRLDTSQRRAERSRSARRMRGGSQRSGAGQQSSRLLIQRADRVARGR